MVSVIIPTLNAEESLPRCFNSLIAATVQGVVREVIVADGGSSDATLAIADAAGAHVVQAGRARAEQLAAGALAARSDWLLFLRPETALEPGWEAEAESFIGHVTPENPRAAAFRFGLDEFGRHARRVEALAGLRSWLFSLPYGEQGLLVPKRLYHRVGGYRAGAMEDVDLVRRIGARRLVILRARAINKAPQRAGGLRNLALTLLHTLRLPTAVLARLDG